MKIKVFLLLIIGLWWVNPLAAKDDLSVEDQLVGVMFKNLAKAYVSVSDYERLKKDTILRLKGMEDERFKACYAKSLAVISEFPQEVKIKYGINENSIVLLAHGNISDERGLADIIELSRHLRDDIIIVLHGKLLQRILKNLPMNVFMRNEVLSEDDLMEYIAMADIGLAIYNDISENNKYVAFSSHKIAIYSRCGLPYIAYHNESFEVLNEMIVWGVTVNNVNEITKAIDHIMTNYTFYQKQTQLAYEGIYCFDKYRETLIEYITN